MLLPKFLEDMGWESSSVEGFPENILKFSVETANSHLLEVEIQVEDFFHCFISSKDFKLFRVLGAFTVFGVFRVFKWV